MPGKTPPSELSDHLGYWLRYVSNHVSNAFARKVESHGVTVAEWVLLRQLFDTEPQSPSRLAEGMGATRGTVTKLVDRLIDKALVSRKAHASDQRAQILQLTPAGRSLVPKLAKLADRNEGEFFDHLTADQRNSLVALLRDIVERRGLATLPIE
jgi:MarR family transcriptional regulator, lower aerobic nicotinate degradation pathway regulator